MKDMRALILVGTLLIAVMGTGHWPGFDVPVAAATRDADPGDDDDDDEEEEDDSNADGEDGGPDETDRSPDADDDDDDQGTGGPDGPGKAAGRVALLEPTADDPDSAPAVGDAARIAALASQWSDPPDDEFETEAGRIALPGYIDRCANRAACAVTVALVEQQLSQLLTTYAANSIKRRKEVPPTAALMRGTSKYDVLPGQQLQLYAGRAGVNDPRIWSQVKAIIPRPQSDRLLGDFWVFRKKQDSTLAYVQGMEDSTKFRMGINEPAHLATDAREQYLTIAHELMHMIVIDQQLGDTGAAAGPQDDRSRKLGIGQLLDFQFGDEESEEPAAAAPACPGVRDDDGCYPPGSIYAEFVRRFWTRADLENHDQEDFYARNASRFVTEYATSSPHEDIAESFSYWVIAEGKGTTTADAKQRFFARFPELVALKQHIRRTVIADILRRRPSATGQ